MTALRQGHGQVDRNSGFTHPAFAAGDAYDFGGSVVTHG
jgi:hypothetical protein